MFGPRIMPIRSENTIENLGLAKSGLYRPTAGPLELNYRVFIAKSLGNRVKTAIHGDLGIEDRFFTTQPSRNYRHVLENPCNVP